jgi:small multidrug resistance family-3 protein
LPYAIVLTILVAAAILEAGGDALVRAGLHSANVAGRAVFLFAGGVVLFAYGYVVNAPPWDFGRLLGVYVAFFFVIAQAISWIGFGHKPSASVLFGGAFIVLGGYIVSRG